MAKENKRLVAIDRLRSQAMSKVHAALKARSINVPEMDEAADDVNVRRIKAALKDKGVSVPSIDGPSKDADMHNLQQWQALAAGLEAADSSGQADNRGYSTGLSFASSEALDQAASADAMDSGTPKSKGKG